MDKILAFLKEAKWFSISIAIFMVIWLGPKLLDSIEENRIEAEQKAWAENRRIAEEKQLVMKAIEKADRLAKLEIEQEEKRKREAIEKVERKKRLAANEIAIAKRLAAEKIRKEKEEEQREIEKRKLKELEVGLVCKDTYPGNIYGNVRESRALLVELILIRNLTGNVIDGLSIVENKYDGTEKTIKEFYSAKSNESAYSEHLKNTEVNYSIYVNSKINATHPSFEEEWNNYKSTIHIDRASLDFTFTDDYYNKADGKMLI